jgi:hypothetical protein
MSGYLRTWEATEPRRRGLLGKSAALLKCYSAQPRDFQSPCCNRSWDTPQAPGASSDPSPGRGHEIPVAMATYRDLFLQSSEFKDSYSTAGFTRK